MTTYLIVYFIVFILAIYSLMTEKKDIKILYIFFSIFIVLFIGLRKHLGGSDYTVYVRYFQNMVTPDKLDSYSYFIKYQPLYEFLNSFLRIFTNNYYVLFFIIAICTAPVWLILTYKWTRYPFFVILFYFYKTFFYSNFVVMRQLIAMMIFLISIKFLIERKFLKYFILNIIGFLFHSSAIMMIPLYFITKLKFEEYNFKKILGIIFILIIFRDPMLYFLAQIFFSLDTTKMGNEIINLSTSSQINFHLFEAWFYMLIFYKLRKNIKGKEVIFYRLFIIYFILLTIFCKYTIFIRVSMYLYISIMVMFSKKLEIIKNKKAKLLFVYIFGLLFCLGYMKYIIFFNNGTLMPYRNILI